MQHQCHIYSALVVGHLPRPPVPCFPFRRNVLLSVVRLARGALVPASQDVGVVKRQALISGYVSSWHKRFTHGAFYYRSQGLGQPAHCPQGLYCDQVDSAERKGCAGCETRSCRAVLGMTHCERIEVTIRKHQVWFVRAFTRQGKHTCSKVHRARPVDHT